MRPFYRLLLPCLLWLPPVFATDALWLREPALSPDGQQLAFTWQGQIYLSAGKGGVATPLTGSDYLSQRPLWSPDGKLIAFSANLYGNEDVFVMPASGGAMTRLTYDSRDDLPQAFSADGKQLLLSSFRPATPDADHFVAEGTNNSTLYWTPVTGGGLTADQPLPATLARPHGGLLAYQMPGMDQPFRKHQQSFAVSRLWLFDGKQHRQLTEDRVAASDPVWSDKGDTLFYLSERSGDFNVWQRDLASGKEQQLTHYKGHPVRDLSASRNGDLVWSWQGELYRLDAGGKTPYKLAINPLAARPPHDQFNELVSVDGATVSQDGEEVIAVSQGDLFAIDIDRKRIRQLTRHPSEQSAPLYVDKDQALIYLSEQDGHAALYRLTKAEPDRRFSEPGQLIEQPLLAMPDAAISKPVLSPDGKQLVFVVNGQAVHLLDLASGKQRQLVAAEFNPGRHSVELAFAPDSRHLALTIQPDSVQQEIAVIDTRDPKAKPVNVSLNGYQDGAPAWSQDGSLLYWQSTKYGALNADSEPLGGSILALYSSRAAKADVLAERTPPKGGYGFESSKLSHRALSLLQVQPDETLLASKIVDGALIYLVNKRDPNGNNELKGYSQDLRDGETRVLFSEGISSDLAFLNDNATQATVVTSGEITRFDLQHDTSVSAPFSLLQESNWQARMYAAYEQVARLTRDEFYLADMNGVDWDSYVAAYRRLLPGISNERDFGKLLAELAGELNVSHTWGIASATRTPYMADDTASLGGYWREDKQGVTLHALLAGGPLEQETDIVAGSRLLAINGEPVRSLAELDRQLNHQADQRLTLTFQSKGEKTETDVEVTAITLEQEYQLRLDGWVTKRREQVAALSKGRVGYVYLPEMSSAAYEEVVADALGRQRKAEALIVDVRFNKGGYLANTLVNFLTGNGAAKGIARSWPRTGEGETDAASRQWTKPSVVLANAGSYSEGSAFPQYYRTLNIGPIVGEPVPGTGTMVYSYASNLLPGLSYGIPTLGLRAPDGSMYENQELIPDQQVPLTPADIVAGRDPQLNAAVDTALAQIAAATK